MRNYENIDKYITELGGDIYPQPEDAGHSEMTLNVLNQWISELDLSTVLDIGCGATALSEPFFKEKKVLYTGISLGDDVVTAQALDKNVLDMDMSFLEFPDGTFDLVWARHVLEHSVMPLLTLMEWWRVSRKYLCVIIPSPEYFTYVGRNHYSVMTSHQMVWLLRRAGWKLIRHELLEQEFRFLCEKRTRISYEGYVEAPLNQKVHDFEHTEFLGGR